MKNEKLLEYIEQLNYEKIKFKNSYKARVLEGLYVIKRPWKLISFMKRYFRRKYEKIEKTDILSFPSITDKKIVVYSCITEGYDDINEPVYHNSNVEYVLFTDRKITNSNWIIKNIPDKVKKLNSGVLINRYMKMHPYEFFKDYDYAIYIDGNIRSLTDISGFVSKINSKSGLAMFKHYARTCIYDERKVCDIYKKGNKKKLKEQVNKYKNEGFPKHFGLLEATIVVSDLKSKKAQEILEKWYQEFISSESLRDQISLPYVLWKNNYSIDDIGYLGNNIRFCPKIDVTYHKK